jgi:hypothetical protein
MIHVPRSLSDKREALFWEAYELAFLHYLCRGKTPAHLKTIVAATISDEALWEYTCKYNPDQPRVPAGNPDGGQWTSGGDGDDDSDDDDDDTDTPGVPGRGDGIWALPNNPEAATPVSDTTSAPASWGDPDTLQRHFNDHGADFNAQTPQDYANQANQFLNNGVQNNLPAVQGADGRVRMYDPATNTFGVYNSDGTTASFYKPTDGAAYFQGQVDYDLSNGGQVINPLPETGGGSGSGEGGGGSGPINPKLPDAPRNIEEIENE